MQAGHSHDDDDDDDGPSRLIVDEEEEAGGVKSLPPSTAKVTTSNNCEVGMLWPRRYRGPWSVRLLVCCSKYVKFKVVSTISLYSTTLHSIVRYVWYVICKNSLPMTQTEDRENTNLWDCSKPTSINNNSSIVLSLEYNIIITMTSLTSCLKYPTSPRQAL